MSNSGPSVLDKFKSHLNRNTCQGQDVYGTRDFIAPQAIDDFHWTRDKINDALGLLPDPDPYRPPLPSPHTILEKYKVVFSILVSISRPSAISEFINNQLEDERLPFTTTPVSWSDDSTKSNLFQEFLKNQWKFCPLVFKSSWQYSKTELSDNQVLPILRKEPLDQDAHRDGHDVVLYKVELHPHSRGILPVSHVRAIFDSCNVTDHESPRQQTVIFKQYQNEKSDVIALYDNEVDLYGQIQQDPNNHIVQYYGSFHQVGRRTVVLEYADKGNLAEFFAQHGPIEDTLVRGLFFQAFMDLLLGLVAIHNLRLQDEDDGRPHWILKG